MGVHEVGYMRQMQWWRIEMVRSGVGGDFDPKARYQMCCIWYWPMIKIDGSVHGRSTKDGVCGVNVVVVGGEGEIGWEWDFDPQNRKLVQGTRCR